MNQKAIVSAGIVAVCVVLFLGFLLIIPWQIAGVLVAVSIGIPTMLFAYERSKSTVSISQAKLENENEGNRQPTPLTLETKEQNDTTGSPLLPDITEITKLRIDNSFIDQIYKEAQSKAVKIYDDIKLSYFGIQAYPFDKPSSVNIYFEFYSKWTGRIVSFQYSDLTSILRHCLPNKQAIAFQKGFFQDLPWKTSPHFLRALSKVYEKIKPLPSIEGTSYHMYIMATKKQWKIIFEDGINGNEYWFDWDGLGLEETNIKQAS